MTRLAIGRLSLDIAAAGARDPAALRDRIATIARRDLAKGLAQIPDGDGDEAVHIRRLDIDLTVIGDIAPDRIGVELGRRIGQAIDALRRAPDERTVVFADPAARLATYLAALIQGDPVDRWWLAPFESLSVLPRPRALTTVLERDGDETQAALKSLPERTRRQLPGFLGAQEARRFLEATITVSDAAVDGAVVHLAELQTIPQEDAAMLAVALLMGGCDLDAPLGAIAAAANLVAGAIRAAPTSRPARTLRPDATVAAAAIAAAPFPAAAKTLFASLDLPARAAVVARGRGPLAHRTPAEDGDRFAPTRFANLAVLWPFVDDLPLKRVHGGASPAGVDPDRLMTLLVLASAAGPEHAVQIWHDPVWRRLLGIPPAVRLAPVRRALGKAPPPARIRSERRWRRSGQAEQAWLAGGAASLVGPALAPRLVRPAFLALRRLAARLPGFDGSSAPYLWVNLLHGEGCARQADGQIEIELARPPLDILLSITGLGDRTLQLRDGRTLSLRRGRRE